MYYIVYKKSRNIVDMCKTFRDAKQRITELEQIDKEKGIYIENRYDIADKNLASVTNECIPDFYKFQVGKTYRARCGSVDGIQTITVIKRTKCYAVLTGSWFPGTIKKQISDTMPFIPNTEAMLIPVNKYISWFVVAIDTINN